MELRHLRYFVMAAEEANISRAAARLNVSQPAVSRQIRDLEEELGSPLFLRESNGLRLTEAGETALVHAREVLRQAQGMVEGMRAFADGGRAVAIQVGYLPTALPGFLTEGLRRFQRAYPKVCVQIAEMSPAEQERALHEGKIDLALIGEPRPEVRAAFHVRTVRRTEMAVVVPDDHRLSGRKSADLSELADDSFVTLHEDHFPDRPRLLAEIFSRAEIDPRVTVKARGLSELLGLVGGGAGVALAPADLEQLPHGGVSFLRLRRPKQSLLFSAAWRKTGDASVVEAFVEQLADVLGEA